jgi:FkbM family methyltransferase
MAIRRMNQTIRSFDNGPSVLARMARGHLTTDPGELVFRTGNLSIVTPNRPGARLPVYELFVEDSYSLNWFTGDLTAPTVVDIGAHVGCFSLAVADQVPGSLITSFEATPTTFEYLKRNVRGNGLQDRISIHATAVSGANGTIEFAETGTGSGHNGVLHLGSPGTTTIRVPSVTIRDAFELAGRPVDVVKIDAEGAEYDMILGSTIDDWAPVRRVVMEYHRVEGHSWDELESFLDAAGLHVADHVRGGQGYGMTWLSRDELGPRP